MSKRTPAAEPESSPIRELPLTLDEHDKIAWSLHCIAHLIGAAYCTDESEGKIVDASELPEILSAMERHTDTIKNAFEAADARRPRDEKGGAQ